jgi:hypothetical protein
MLNKLLSVVSLSILAVALAAPAADAAPRLLSAPPVFLFVGDDSDALAAYAAAVPEHTPQGVTLSTRLTAADPQATLDGVFSPAGPEGGVTDFEKTLAAFPDAKLAVGLSLSDAPECRGTHTRKIAAGDYDDSLGALVDFLAGLKPRAVFLAIGPEFDGPWNCYEPVSYKQAFRAVHAMLEARGANNVVTVWHSAAWPVAGAPVPGSPEHLERWYPGDDDVDWIGMSVFAVGESRWKTPPEPGPATLLARLLRLSRDSGKPAMVAAAAPRGLRLGASTVSPIDADAPQQVTSEELWDAWHQPFFDFVHANRDVLRIVAYANADGPRGDSRVQADELVKKRWLDEVLNVRVWFQ